MGIIRYYRVVGKTGECWGGGWGSLSESGFAGFLDFRDFAYPVNPFLSESGFSGFLDFRDFAYPVNLFCLNQDFRDFAYPVNLFCLNQDLPDFWIFRILPIR